MSFSLTSLSTGRQQARVPEEANQTFFKFRGSFVNLSVSCCWLQFIRLPERPRDRLHFTMAKQRRLKAFVTSRMPILFAQQPPRWVFAKQLGRPHKSQRKSVTDPFQMLIATADRLGISHHRKGTVLTDEGPRFTTKAENIMFQLWGGDVINMTTFPEASVNFYLISNVYKPHKLNKINCCPDFSRQRAGHVLQFHRYGDWLRSMERQWRGGMLVILHRCYSISLQP